LRRGELAVNLVLMLGPMVLGIVVALIAIAVRWWQ
jgi:hypothetical protein